MEKVFITDEDGNEVLPKTHVSCVLDDDGNPVVENMQETQENQQVALNHAVEDIENHNARILKLEEGGGGSSYIIEGYLRVSGSADPALSYRHYARQEGAAQDSVFEVFYPCLVGNNLTGDVGAIKHVLRKLGARTATAEDTAFTEGQAIWLDTDGTPHAIDGSEGDVMIVNTVPYWQIMGHYDVEGITLDVFLRSRAPFVWRGIEAEKIEPFGWSPDYTVAHNDDGTVVMHSVYNPAWNGSYSAPYGVAGRYVVTTDPQTGELTETYDASATMLGGAGGLHTTDLASYTGEQYAMNMQGGAQPVPYYSQTARGAELLMAGILSEGGTFDAHNMELFGSGFCSNDVAVEATYGDGGEARNGLRVYDKDGAWKYYSFATNVRFLAGASSGTQYGCYVVNNFRSPWHIMEAYRVLCHAAENSIPELTWFSFEGCKYKWRSVDGFDGPLKGEATAVVFKMFSTQAGANAKDPTDKTTSIAGNRVDVVVSTGLWHGMSTQVSPAYNTSGLIFTEDENGTYEAYMERDQTKLVLSVDGTKAVEEQFNFETLYKHVGTFGYSEGYRKSFSNDALMLPDSNADKTGARLHTHVGAYNYFKGSKASAGNKAVRAFRRGGDANYTSLSPLCVDACRAPSGSIAYCAFGTCVRVAQE